MKPNEWEVDNLRNATADDRTNTTSSSGHVIDLTPNAPVPERFLSKPLIIDGVDFSEMLTPSEVAEAFSVNTATVARWARAGKLASVQTIGQHRRFSKAQVMALLAGETR